MTSESEPRPISRFSPHAYPLWGDGTLSEEDFYALHERFERMSAKDLAAFRATPENQRLLLQYDSFVLQQALPYAATLTVLSLVSLIVGFALSMSGTFPATP